MPKRKKTKSVSVTKPMRGSENAPVQIWMVNHPNAHMEISRNYIWISLRPGQKPLQYKIDAERLWLQLKSGAETVPVGDLDMKRGYCEKIGEETVILEPAQEELDKCTEVDDEFFFECEVPLREFENAVASVRRQ